MSGAAWKIAGLYAIADTGCLDDDWLLTAVREAIAGGAAVVQYRDKRHDAAARASQADALATVCRAAGIPFIVNDDVELAARCGAQGAHLGRDDLPLAAARARLGADAIIGVSCYNDLARAQAAADAGANYVAFGSFFPSRTKPKAVRADMELLRRARASLHIPIVAIGGITPENGVSLVQAGADALAVVDGLFGQVDVRGAAGRYASLFCHHTESA